MDLKLQTYVKLLNFTKQGRQALLWESAFLFSVKQRPPTRKGHENSKSNGKPSLAYTYGVS